MAMVFITIKTIFGGQQEKKMKMTKGSTAEGHTS